MSAVNSMSAMIPITPRRYPSDVKEDLNARVVTPRHLRHWSQMLVQSVGEAELRRQLDFADSYTRLGAVMALAAAPDFLALLVEHWSSCDNIAEWTPEIKRVLSEARRRGLFPLPSPPDDSHSAAVYAALPSVVTVFRGAYTSNGKGLCWSLDRSVAAKFPFLNRYRRADAVRTALLFKATVPKSAIAFLNNTRSEQEVVVLPKYLTLVSWDLAGEVIAEFDPEFLQRNSGPA